MALIPKDTVFCSPRSFPGTRCRQSSVASSANAYRARVGRPTWIHIPVDAKPKSRKLVVGQFESRALGELEFTLLF
jgi:hypothetical protein